MNQETGRFDEARGAAADLVARAALARMNEPGRHQYSTLQVGEVVEIKMVKFRVTRIKADGKVGLKMLCAAELAPRPAL